MNHLPLPAQPTAKHHKLHKAWVWAKRVTAIVVCLVVIEILIVLNILVYNRYLLWVWEKAWETPLW